MTMELEPSLVDQVLQRLELSARPEPDLDGLKSLYDAWCRRVPFDNVRKLIALSAEAPGRLPGDDPADFFETWLQSGVGGTCWAGNGALCALLQNLGFAAHRGTATMLVAPNLPPNHGTVAVNLPQGRFLVDASILFVEPLPLVDGRESSIDHGAWGVQGHWLDDKFAVRWRALHRQDFIDCRVDEWPVDADRFHAQHEATRTWSPFNFELTFNLVRDDGRIGIAGNQAVYLQADGSLTVKPLTDRMAFLVEELGISEALAARIPDDLPTPPPPGSKTAADAAN